MKYISFLLLLLITISCSENAKKQSETKPSEDNTEITDNKKDTIPGNQKEDTVITSDIHASEITSAEVPEEFVDVDWLAYEESMTQDFSFVIIISTKSYDAALKRAKEASEKLGYPLDLRELHENKEIGLSFSKKVCEEDICGGGLSYPIYIPRSDWGDSQYISVEYSDAFDGFSKGYYIVVVASGEKGSSEVNETLLEARKFYSDAYAKTCGVWMGCGC